MNKKYNVICRKIAGSILLYVSFYLQNASLKILLVLKANWRLKGFKDLSEAENTFSEDISKELIQHFAGRFFQMIEIHRRLPQQCQLNNTKTDWSNWRIKKNSQSVEDWKKGTCGFYLILRWSRNLLHVFMSLECFRRQRLGFKEVKLRKVKCSFFFLDQTMTLSMEILSVISRQ